MGFVLAAVLRTFEKPTAWGVVTDMAVLASPLWAAALLGLLLGWAWRPRWAAGLVGAAGEEAKATAAEVGAAPARSPPSWGLPRLDFLKGQVPTCLLLFGSEEKGAKEEKSELGLNETRNEELAVGKDDFIHLWKLVEVRDGGPAWIKMMEKGLPKMSYQAWRRDPENGPPQYRSSTIFEDASPEEVREFFWDDEFRMSNKWDDMLIYHNTLEECQTTGTMRLHWIRKFPFFCSDREYIIGRRIWKLGSTYFCVTKGVPCSSIPRKKKPRRVDLYYSSWCIRAVESRRGNGEMTACEVLLFHHEDMGIPREIAKLGIRQGMWGCVKRIEPGLRAYQRARISGEPLSRSAFMAQVNTKVGNDFVRSLESDSDEADAVEEAKEKPWFHNIPRFLVLGSAVALACTLDRGLLTKALIFGVARRFVRQRKTL